MSIALAIAFAASGLYAAHAVVVGRREWKRQAKAWRGVAARRGGRLDERSRRLLVDIGDARIEVLRAKRSTLLRAMYPVPAGPIFVLYPRSGPRHVALGDLLSSRKVETGIRRLDASYVLRTREPDASRALWTPRAATLLAEHFPDALVRGEPGTVSIDIPEVVFEARLLDAAVEVAQELGNAELFGLSTLRGLPDAEPLPGGAWIAVAGVTVRFQAVGRAHGPVTLAWAEVGGDAFEARLPPEDPEALAARLPVALPPEAIRDLARMGSGVLVGKEEQVQFHWLEVERDAGRLMAAARVLSAFAERPAQGPYR